MGLGNWAGGNCPAGVRLLDRHAHGGWDGGVAYTAAYPVRPRTATSACGVISSAISRVPTLTFTLSLPPSATPTQTETPATTGLPTEFTDEFGIRMALVPAGPFQMGSQQGEADEQPVHTVELGDYYMDVTEVTNASYAAFLNAQGNQSEGGVTWLDAGDEYARIHQNGGEWQPDSATPTTRWWR